MRIWLAVCLALSSSLHAGDGSAATALPAFKLLRGARPAALAGAYTALGDDAQALFYNPAALVELRYPELAASHLEWFDGVRDDAAALCLPLYGLGGWALGVHYTYASDQARDNWGTPLGAFSTFDFSAQVAYALQLGLEGGVGLLYKIIRQGYTAHFNMGSAFDFGLRYKGLFKRRLIVALASQNMGTPAALGTFFAPAPWTLRAGLALRASERLQLSLDYEHQPLDFFNKWRLGAEWGLEFKDSAAALRLGWLLGPENQAGSLAGLHAGLGASYRSWQLDYALAPMGDLGLSHRLSFSLKFGAH